MAFPVFLTFSQNHRHPFLVFDYSYLIGLFYQSIKVFMLTFKPGSSKSSVQNFSES